MKTESYITGLGAFLPGPPIPAKEIEDYLGSIFGQPSRHRVLALRQNKIQTRHFAIDKNGTPISSSSEMAAQAIQNAIKNSEVPANEIGYLACSSTLGDMLVPGLASAVHGQLKFKPLEIANFQSVCASSMMAIKSAWLQTQSGEHRHAVVSGCEFASRYFRPGHYEILQELKADRTVPYELDFLRFTLSDGAGAAIISQVPNRHRPSLRIKWIDIKSYADRFPTCMSAGIDRQQQQHWSEYPDPAMAAAQGCFVLRQDFALMHRMIPVWVGHYLDLIEQGKIDPLRIDYFCSHYSSHSLREKTIDLLKQAGAMIDEEKWFSNLPTKGNTGTASIFIMLEELYNSGRLKSGEVILCHVPESGRSINSFMFLEVV